MAKFSRFPDLVMHILLSYDALNLISSCFRALFLMSKSGFRPPQLKDKNKWYVKALSHPVVTLNFKFQITLKLLGWIFLF